jgi:hypothetical protein
MLCTQIGEGLYKYTIYGTLLRMEAGWPGSFNA